MRIFRSPARKLRVDPHHRPAAAHAERDAIDPHVFIGIIYEVVADGLVARRERQGRQQVAVTERALGHVISILARTRRDRARLICVPIQPRRAAVARSLAERPRRRAELRRRTPHYFRAFDDLAPLSIPQPVFRRAAWVHK